MFVGLVSVGAWNGAHLRPHVPPARLRVWRFAVIMNTGENKESGSVDGSRFGDLWSEFSVDQDDESEGGQLLGDSDDDEAWVDELPDVEWDEPEGDENDEPNGRPVLGVGNYMEVLMQKKYGDDWELLLADANLQWGLEAAADEPRRTLACGHKRAGSDKSERAHKAKPPWHHGRHCVGRRGRPHQILRAPTAAEWCDSGKALH